MTPWMVVTVVSKSSTSWLIETFMTAWSRTMTNWAAASAASEPESFMGTPPARDGIRASPQSGLEIGGLLSRLLFRCLVDPLLLLVVVDRPCGAGDDARRRHSSDDRPHGAHRSSHHHLLTAAIRMSDRTVTWTQPDPRPWTARSVSLVMPPGASCGPSSVGTRVPRP